MKRYVLIAGVNGAGKSTLYQTLKNFSDMPRVNTDEILREFGNWNDMSDVLKAGRIAVERIDKYFKAGISFNQETTLCGRSIIKNIQRAKSMGYYIELHYVGVDNVEIAKNRVKARVQCGGHGIPDKDIERRYINTFKNLLYILPECDLAAFYDNTQNFRRFAIFRNGAFVRISHNVPQWFIKNIDNKREENFYERNSDRSAESPQCEGV